MAGVGEASTTSCAASTTPTIRARRRRTPTSSQSTRCGVSSATSRSVKIDVQNFDGYGFGIKREWFLDNLARVVGLDLYIVADKHF